MYTGSHAGGINKYGQQGQGSHELPAGIIQKPFALQKPLPPILSQTVESGRFLVQNSIFKIWGKHESGAGFLVY
jgi:hypothetical protein